MIRLFFKTAIRNLTKDPKTSILNIGGLMVGLIVFLYIMVHVYNEFSFDRFHKKADRIYRCVSHIKFGDTEYKAADSNDPLAEAILSDLPEVEASVRIYPERDIAVGNGSFSFMEPVILYADSGFFNVFDFKLISGNKATALSGPNDVLITEKVSKKYFGNSSPLGELLIIGEKHQQYKVVGILADIPKNSHLQFDIVASYSSIENTRYASWGNWDGTYTYILLRPDTDISKFREKYAAFPTNYYAETLKDAIGVDWHDFVEGGNFIIPQLQPLKEIHLATGFESDLPNKGNARLLIILELVSILILIIACVNYINISTARASGRAQEIGIKKVTGSKRSRLVLQFIFEAFIQCFIALVLALFLYFLLLPVINRISGLDVGPNDITNRLTLLIILMLPFILAFLAGGYPALYITGQKPVNVMKSRVLSDKNGKWIRGGLVSFQFAISVILILSVIVITKQLNFIKNEDIGLETDNIVELYNIRQLGDSKLTFKEEILKDPNIVAASFSALSDPGGNPFGPYNSQEKILMNRIEADKDFIQTYQIKMLDGKFFESTSQSERQNVVINETAARILGVQNCNDTYIHDYNRGGDSKVIGIVRDFQVKSFHFKIEPTVIVFDNDYGYLGVRLNKGATSQALSTLEKTWKNFDALTPFSYVFKNDALDRLYKSEEQLSAILRVSTIFAIIIACLGLLGLVSYTANSRRKEIGVRKVNGANLIEILSLLNQDFLKWVLVSLVIALPVSWIIIDNWLNSFSVRTDLNWWLFVIAGLTAIGIALITVSWQSWKAANRNPVEALRYE